MFGRKRKVSAEIREAVEDRAEAQALNEELNRQWPRIQSMVSTVRERRRENGFGDDYTISVTPRRNPA